MSTIQLHRVLKARSELVYRAFLEPEAISRWLPPDGYLCKVHYMDSSVGGSYSMSFIQFSTQQVHTFSGTYVELIPNEKIVYTDQFNDPVLSAKMRTTVELKAVSCGTDICITQDGVPDVIPEEECYLGWQESLTYLAKLVESFSDPAGILYKKEG